MRIRLFGTGDKPIVATDSLSANESATGIVWAMTPTSMKTFFNVIPLEIQVTYIYWSQEEEQAGTYSFPTYINGIKEDGTVVLIDAFTVTDRFGNASGSVTRQLNVTEEFAQIQLTCKHWKYKAGSKLGFVLKKAKIEIKK